jgi:hypothetical protein
VSGDDSNKEDDPNKDTGSLPRPSSSETSQVRVLYTENGTGENAERIVCDPLFLNKFLILWLRDPQFLRIFTGLRKL